MEVNLNGLPLDPTTQIKSAFRRISPTEVREAVSVTADELIMIQHNLLATPRAIFATTDTSGATVYTDADAKALWTPTEVAVKCSAADVSFDVLLIG